MLTLTEKAKEKIKEMMNQEGGNYFLRLYVIPSGCCGVEFGMELTNETDSSDSFIDFEDFKVVVDDFSYPFVENLEIDIVEKEGKAFFVINSKVSSCGCGSCECGSCGCGSSGCECSSEKSHNGNCGCCN